jgi:hypothetical protein
MTEPLSIPNPVPKAKKNRTQGSSAVIVRWMMKHAKTRPASLTMIRDGSGVVPHNISNLVHLGIVVKVGPSTYQISPEFKDVPPPGPEVKLLHYWAKQVREERLLAAIKGAKPVMINDLPEEADTTGPINPKQGWLAPVTTITTGNTFTITDVTTNTPMDVTIDVGPSAATPPRKVTDDDMLTALDMLMDGKLLTVHQAALVTEWLEITRRIVS